MLGQCTPQTAPWRWSAVARLSARPGDLLDGADRAGGTLDVRLAAPPGPGKPSVDPCRRCRDAWPTRDRRGPVRAFSWNSGRTPIARGGPMAYKFITIDTGPPQHDNTLRLISPIPLSCGASPLHEALDERRRQDHLQGPHLLGNRVTSLRERRSVMPEPFSTPRNSIGSPAGH
jgi:hypothetical protein